MNVLIVEDNLRLQKSVGVLMKIWNFDFDMASNGQEAVEKAKKNEGKYDLCIMDVEMPIMNGCEATRIIRRDLSYFPILAYSGNYLYCEESMNSGADDFVEKPCSPNDLLAKIRELAVKTYQFVFNGKDILLKKEMPMDQQHAKELRELANQGLRKMKLFDSPGSTVIVHKNVANKISHDFIVEQKLVTSFVNRDPDKPTRCDLYKESNYLMPQTFLTEEECNDVLKAEDEDLERYTEMAEKKEG